MRNLYQYLIRLKPALPLPILLLTASPAHAAILTASLATDCAASGSSFYCRMLGLLNLLYVVAAILGILLVFIALFAYVAYRRNQKRTLDETRRS